ncbi:hypothetical protein FDECE_16154 [Fusarium decemcellulare]|nr:hypothetical protein FDECE_16154 [Fusarium decemcellulare]
MDAIARLRVMTLRVQTEKKMLARKELIVNLDNNITVAASTYLSWKSSVNATQLGQALARTVWFLRDELKTSRGLHESITKLARQDAPRRRPPRPGDTLPPPRQDTGGGFWEWLVGGSGHSKASDLEDDEWVKEFRGLRKKYTGVEELLGYLRGPAPTKDDSQDTAVTGSKTTKTCYHEVIRRCPMTPPCSQLMSTNGLVTIDTLCRHSLLPSQKVTMSTETKPTKTVTPNFSQRCAQFQRFMKKNPKHKNAKAVTKDLIKKANLIQPDWETIRPGEEKWPLFWETNPTTLPRFITELRKKPVCVNTIGDQDQDQDHGQGLSETAEDAPGNQMPTPKDAADTIAELRTQGEDEPGQVKSLHRDSGPSLNATVKSNNQAPKPNSTIPSVDSTCEQQIQLIDDSVPEQETVTPKRVNMQAYERLIAKSQQHRLGNEVFFNRSPSTLPSTSTEKVTAPPSPWADMSKQTLCKGLHSQHKAVTTGAAQDDFTSPYTAEEQEQFRLWYQTKRAQQKQNRAGTAPIERRKADVRQLEDEVSLLQITKDKLLEERVGQWMGQTAGRK